MIAVNVPPAPLLCSLFLAESGLFDVVLMDLCGGCFGQRCCLNQVRERSTEGQS